MNLRSIAVALALAGTIFFSGCGGQSRIEAEYLPIDQKSDFVVKPGMSRNSVEAVYGIPTDIGVTKNGNTYAHYRFDTAVRSVVYDDETVVVAYP